MYVCVGEKCTKNIFREGLLDLNLGILCVEEGRGEEGGPLKLDFRFSGGCSWIRARSLKRVVIEA